MMDVATVALARGALAPAVADAWQLLLADGVEVTVRRAIASDAQAVLDLYARCSVSNRLRRYLAGGSEPAVDSLARVISQDGGYNLVVEDADGRLVATASLIRHDGNIPELGVLVEDSWQSKRIGTVLARRVVAHAQEGAIPHIRTVVHAGNTSMVRIMTGLGHRLHREYDGGMLTLIANLQQPGRPPTRSNDSPTTSA
jgi:GNAT superfamily N-acetyltransferase